MIALIKFVFSVPIWIANEISGNVFVLKKADNILKARIEDRTKTYTNKRDPKLKLPLNHLDSLYLENLARLRVVEDKARSSVFGISIAVAFSSVGIPIITNPNGLGALDKNTQQVAAILFLSAILFLLISGYLAIVAYSVGGVHLKSIVDHPSLMGDRKLKLRYIDIIELNDLYIIRKANFLSSSMDCLRNAMVLFSLFMFFSIYSILK